MKPTKVKFAFECPNCGEIHHAEDELETISGWRIESDNAILGSDSGGPSYVLDEPEEVRIYQYAPDDNEECVGEIEPTYQAGYQCSECDRVYIDEAEATACCKA